MTDRRAFLRLAALSALAVPLGCSSDKPKAPTAVSPTPTGVPSEAEQGALQVGDPIPEIRSEAIEGPEIDTARFRGHPLIINFWASTCGPCVREFPLLKKVIEKHSDFPILGINVMERKEPAAEFVRKHDGTWPSIWDPDGSIAAKFGVRVLPVTYAVGRDFTLVDRRFGELDSTRLESMVEAVLKS